MSWLNEPVSGTATSCWIQLGRGRNVARGLPEPLAGDAAVTVEVRDKRRTVVQPVQWFSQVVHVADGVGAALVAHQPEQTLGKGASDLGRARQVLVFFLPQPPE